MLLTQLPKFIVQDFLQLFENKSTATYLLSYPKCGVTWLKFMLIQALTELNGISDKNLSVDINKITTRYPQLPLIVWSHDESEIINENGFHPDPNKLFVYPARVKYFRKKVILLVRDPRDTVVSYFHHVTRRSERPMAFDGLSEFIRSPRYGFKRILKFYEIWHHNRWLPKDLLILRYEDLVMHGVVFLSRVLRFIGSKENNHKQLERIYNFSKADNMRKLEKNGKIDGMRNFGNDNNSLKVRKAKIGSYQNEMNESDIAYCNRLMRFLAPIYGYTTDNNIRSNLRR